MDNVEGPGKPRGISGLVSGGGRSGRLGRVVCEAGSGTTGVATGDSGGEYDGVWDGETGGEYEGDEGWSSSLSNMPPNSCSMVQLPCTHGHTS